MKIWQGKIVLSQVFITVLAGAFDDFRTSEQFGASLVNSLTAPRPEFQSVFCPLRDAGL